MTNLQPFTVYNTSSVIDEKRLNLKNPIIEWIFPISERFKTILEEPIDEFEYPSLEDLRKQFEETKLYTKEKIDEIIKVYERLPKYRAGSRSARRSRKRG